MKLHLITNRAPMLNKVGTSCGRTYSNVDEVALERKAFLDTSITRRCIKCHANAT